MNTLSIQQAALSLTLLALAACTPTTEEVPEEEEQTHSAAAALRGGGTYMFVFDESKEVKARVTSACEADHRADAKAVASCIDAIRRAGAKEGIRVAIGDGDNFTWTSFGLEDEGRERVYLKAPLAVVRVDGARVHAAAAGVVSGEHAGSKKTLDDIVFEVVDDATVAMVDPKKGRLVFRRQAE